MNKKTKKIFAREFIYLVIATILSFIIFFGCLYFQERNYKSSKVIESEIKAINDVLPKKQLLWIECIENKFYSDSYNEFELKYSDVENQKFLYQQLKNNELYTESLDDFRIKYFRKEAANKDAYELYQIDNGWISEDEFSSLLKDSEVLNWLYKRFIETGYGGTFIDFKNLISGTEDKILSESEFRNQYDKIKVLEQELEQKKSSIFNNELGDNEIFGIALIVFSILFLLRYLFYGIKWSLKQVKE